ncbi:hypothetical protein QNH20_01840 [Neobacillus sp. WH10]|uniref:hypothetical protein n=1 Tax=Neobacillus sp. WH10 TaxID=3047873 RepID=UPI0024C13A98|nr:hypothetical protein [Neobacillus sp. WH10]WHY77945.1 hypothetical protein QNH20_01840 [Neobacillus sp. WH10]
MDYLEDAKAKSNEIRRGCGLVVFQHYEEKVLGWRRVSTFSKRRLGTKLRKKAG